MDKQEFKDKLFAIYGDGGDDTEYDHEDADDLMVACLESLGYDLSLFTAAERWYA